MAQDLQREQGVEKKEVSSRQHCRCWSGPARGAGSAVDSDEQVEVGSVRGCMGINRLGSVGSMGCMGCMGCIGHGLHRHAKQPATLPTWISRSVRRASSGLAKMSPIFLMATCGGGECRMRSMQMASHTHHTQMGAQPQLGPHARQLLIDAAAAARASSPSSPMACKSSSPPRGHAPRHVPAGWCASRWRRTQCRMLRVTGLGQRSAAQPGK